MQLVHAIFFFPLISIRETSSLIPWNIPVASFVSCPSSFSTLFRTVSLKGNQYPTISHTLRLFGFLTGPISLALKGNVTSHFCGHFKEYAVELNAYSCSGKRKLLFTLKDPSRIRRAIISPSNWTVLKRKPANPGILQVSWEFLNRFQRKLVTTINPGKLVTLLETRFIPYNYHYDNHI